MTTPHYTDTEAMDELARFARTPEWSVSMLEDIAEIVRLTGRDIEQPNGDPEREDWEPH